MFQLNANNCIKILNRNFGYSITKDSDFGEIIIMPAVDAFFYSSIEKSPYLIKNKRPFSAFGKLDRVFNFVGEYNLMSGVLNDLHEKKGPKIINSPLIYKSRISNIFSGNKKIIFFELEDSSEEPIILKEICNKIINL